jgi:PPOX class probable F420-dependent enzyme
VTGRAAIHMTDTEAAAFLSEERTVICATLGRDGWPHLMPLWYVVRAGELWSWTYGKSQKVRNLERDPRCSLQVEAGTAYDELRGVLLRCEAVVHRDLATVEAYGAELAGRYAEGGVTPGHAEAMRAQAPKRVALQFTEVGRVTWDHRKLG